MPMDDDSDDGMMRAIRDAEARASEKHRENSVEWTLEFRRLLKEAALRLGDEDAPDLAGPGA